MKLNRKRLLVMFLIVAMSVCMMPGAGLLTGAAPVYADTVTFTGGVVSTSDMTPLADYYFTGDTVIQVESDLFLGSITIGNGVELTLEGDADHILSVRNIESYNGNFTISSGKLEIDSSASEDVWPAAIKLTTGTFTMGGGGLFINFTSNSPSTNTAYGITAHAVRFTDGTAEITCKASARGYAFGISTNDFSMTGGSVGVDAQAPVSGFAAGGITAAGSTSDSTFYMNGGSLRAEGDAASGESYGINWTGDRAINTMRIEGGKLTVSGQYCGLLSWIPAYIGKGAEVEATSDRVAISIEQADLTVNGLGTKLTARTSSSSASAINAYKGDIQLAGYMQFLEPAGGHVGEYGSDGSHTIYDGSDNSAATVKLVSADPIPSNIAVTYDASRAFPTTRLSGYDVSLHLLKSVTSNPGSNHAHDGWYVYSADPDKESLDTSRWTCLVVKNGSSYTELYNSHEPLNTTDEYYLCFNIYPDGSRPFDPNATYNVTVNGQPAEFVMQPYDESGEIYAYKRVYLDESSDTIWSLSVTPEDSKIVPNGSRQFSVTTIAATSDAVDWSVTGNDSSYTYITNEGMLHAGSGENTGHYLTVRATSKVDPTVYNEVTVEVVDEAPSIESVTLECDKTVVCRGSSANIYATVVGTDIHDLTWELSGSDGSSYFNGGSNTSRYLAVGSSETSDQLTVKATSVADPTKYDTWVFTVTDKELVTGPIEITYDESAVTLSESKTGKEVSDAFRAAITSPFGSGLEPDTAPGGWYVYGSPSDPGSRWTCLVKKNGNSYVELFNSDANLSPDDEYYLWFNVEPCSSTHQFDPHMSILDLGITVNGHRVNGDTVKAEWGGTVEVYVRVYLPGQEPDSTDVLERIYGKNRFETAFKAADWLKAQKGLDKFPNVVIASGMDFPDALAGAYLAEVKDAPVLLASEGNAAQVAQYIKDNMAPNGTVYILGGKGAVPENMEAELTALDISKVERLAGKGRYETNILILEAAGVNGQDILVCSGAGYADSLSASAVGKPVFLVGQSLNDAQKDYLDSVKDQLSGNFYAIGGKGAVSEEVFEEFKAYGTGTFERLSGSNRFLTSVAVAQKFFKPKNIDSVVLAYAMNYPDGLAGGPVAYATKSPLLLVNNTNYTDARDYVTRTYALKIKVMGGASLISDEVALDVLNL